MTLGDRVSERSNFITPVRLALAAIVAVWHAFVIAGGHVAEPSLRGLSPSYLAVNGFFILSGFLIAQSVQRRGLAYYAAARILRLYPALVALLLFGTLFAAWMHVADPLMADAPGSWLYPLESLAFLNASGTFPGLFADNPNGSFSLSLWTLRYEALAYLALPVALTLGVLARPVRIWTAWAVFALAFAAVEFVPQTPDMAREALRLGAAFLLGAAIYASRHHIRAGVRELAGAVLVAALLVQTPLFEAAADLVLAWVLFALCFAPVPGNKANGIAGLTRMPDWSYGLYIWHWPVFQILKQAFPDSGPAFLLPAGFAITLVIAALSWTLVERPALRQKHRLAALFRSLRPRAAAASAA